MSLPIFHGVCGLHFFLAPTGGLVVKVYYPCIKTSLGCAFCQRPRAVLTSNFLTPAT
ncbi:hypothetical protein B0H12DRAFT_1208660 [Mycena haematopus]|nr:hypothetical protein B0H12DRAFT_1208660 [Mycena haematopus]